MSILADSEHAPRHARRVAIVSRARDLARVKQLSLAVLGISLVLLSLLAIVAAEASFWLRRF